MRRFLVSILCCLCLSNVFAQNRFANIENRLIAIYSKISRFASEEENVKNNELFKNLLDSVLKLPESYHYEFNNLKIGKVTAPDQSFRIFTWFIVHTNGTYETQGFLQRQIKSTDKVEVYFLKDNAAKLKDPMMANCTPQSWYGATYYEIRQEKYDNVTTYILLGWRPNTIYTQIKVIETFRFDKKDKPAFGHQIIEFKGKGYKKRIIYEYSSKQTMMLRYEKKKKMIVLDHIAPSDDRYTGIYEFYGPDFSIDGYKFKQGKLRYFPDIDLHSPRQKFSDYIPEKLKKKKTHEEGRSLY